MHYIEDFIPSLLEGWKMGFVAYWEKLLETRTSALRGLRTSSIFFPDLAAATKARLNAISSSVAPLIGPCRWCEIFMHGTWYVKIDINYKLTLMVLLKLMADLSQETRRLNLLRYCHFHGCKTNISYEWWRIHHYHMILCLLHCTPRWLLEKRWGNFWGDCTKLLFLVIKKHSCH